MDEDTTVVETAEPLPVEQRIEGLLDAPSEPEAPEGAAEAGPRRDARGRFAKAEEESEASDAEATDAAPDESQPSGEDDQGEAEPEDAPPPIEPPLSWSADKKEAFRALPRDVQEYIATRERERDTEIRRGQNEIAEQRKAIEQERQQYASQLQALIPALQQSIAGEFADIKTIADVERLARDDPDRYARWQAKQTALQAAQAHQLQLAQQQAKEHEERLKAWTAEQEKILLEAIPAWKKDLAAGQREIGAIKEYLVSQGVDREQAANLRDANLILLARKAMLYDKAQAAKAQAKPVVKPAPKVVKPGAPQAQTPNEERIAAQRKELKRSGRIDSAAKLLENFL